MRERHARGGVQPRGVPQLGGGPPLAACRGGKALELGAHCGG